MVNTSYKKLFSEIGESTGFLQLAKLFESDRKIIKFIYLILIILSLAATIYFLFLTFHSYLQFGVFTSIKIYKEDKSKFPSVAFCNVDLFANLDNETLQHIEDYKKKLNILNDSAYYINDNKTPFLSQLTLEKLKNAEFIHQEILSEPVSFRNNFKLSLNETLLSCTYNNKPCQFANFTWFYDVVYGGCYKFTTNEEVLHAGPLYGLQLEVFLGEFKKENDLSNSKGLNLYIFNSSIHSDYNRIIHLNHGMSNNIEISTTFNKKKEAPYNDCLKTGEKLDTEIFEATTLNDMSYNQRHCQILCYQRQVITDCSCYLSAYYNFSASRPCTEVSDETCINIVRNKVYIDLDKYCGDCPEECDMVEYKYFLSSSMYPTESYVTNLQQTDFIKEKHPNMTFAELTESLLAVKVFYPTLEYTEITQTPVYTPIDFIVNIYGSLNILLNISVFGFIDFMLKLFTGLISIFKHKWQQKKNPVVKMNSLSKD